MGLNEPAQDAAEPAPDAAASLDPLVQAGAGRVRLNLRGLLREVAPFFRPYLGRILVVFLFTLAASAAEGAQAWLLQPLLNRVLLRGADTEDEEDDAELLAGLLPGHQAALRAREGTLATDPPFSGPLLGLRSFAGRTAPSGWNALPLCQLMQRSRRVLLSIERTLGPEEQEARAQLLLAARTQRAAEAELLPDPAAASPQARALAAGLSLRAREEARLANFSSAWSTLRWVVLAAIGIAAVLGLCRYLQQVTQRLVVARIHLDLQLRAVRHVLALSAGQLRSIRRGDLLSRLNNDLARMVVGVMLPLTTLLLLQPIRLAVLVAGAVYVSPVLSLGLIVLGLTVLGPVRWGGKLIRRSARDRQSALGDVLEAMHQMFSGVRVVKAFRREEHERVRFGEKTERAYTADVKVIKTRTASRSWLRLINDTTIPIVVVVGGWFVVHQSWGLNAGRFAAFAALVMLMYRPTKSLAMAYNTLQDNLPSLRRVQEVFAQSPAIEDAPDAVTLEAIRAGIRCDGVGFSYDGEQQVLQELSFDAPVGTTTAIVGHTGSGKSTLLDLLARHLDPQEGAVLIDGVPLNELRLASYLQRVAVVSQDPFLFNDSVRENIRYGRLDADDAEIEAAARAARIHDEIAALKGGYDYTVGERGSKLSGGQIQRLTLARAIVRRPEVLLLDEATSALDTKTERLVQEALADLQKTCTTFVIAHRLSTVRHADQILVLDGGRIVERGTHAELIAQGGRYAELIAEMRDAGASSDEAPVVEPEPEQAKEAEKPEESGQGEANSPDDGA